jgi:hypothetical protein
MPVVKDAWQLLRAEGRTEPGWHVRRIHTGAATPIYAALQLPEETKGIIIQIKARFIHAANTFPSSAGFEVSLETIAAGPNGSVRICLRLTEQRYENVFAVLAEDVASSVAGAGSEVAGLAAMIGRLNTWQRFLKQHGEGVLSNQEQVGLFAELTVLRNLLADGLTASDVVTAWRGPWGGAQDFILTTCAVEVKATVSSNPNSIDISNLAQLENRTLPSLILRHLTLTRRSTGETLPEIVDSIETLLAATDPSASLRFGDSLLEVGYLETHRTEYNNQRYAIHQDRQFLVQNDFPRVLADDLRTGVTACSYSIHISACLPYIIDSFWAAQIVHGVHSDR